MIIVKADKVAPPLFDRSLLQVIKLDWPTIFSKGTHIVEIHKMKGLQGKYADMFKPELGTVKGTIKKSHTAYQKECQTSFFVKHDQCSLH